MYIVISLCLCIDYELKQVSHLQPTPAAQRHCQQIVPSHRSLHQYPYNQQQKQLHRYADDDVTLCKCQLRRRRDTSTVVKLADSHHCHESSDDDDDGGECVSPTWQRRSDVDMSGVGRTIDSVDKCQQPLLLSSSSSLQLPGSNDRPQILSSFSSSQNVLVNNVSSTNDDNHRDHMPLTQS